MNPGESTRPSASIRCLQAAPDFGVRITSAMEALGKKAWVDWQDIPPTAEWIDEIKGAIEKAESFAFVISPHSLASEICRVELEAHPLRI